MYTPISEATRPLFYVADLRSHDSILPGKNLRLPKALALYGSFPTDRTPVLGVMREGKTDAELGRRMVGQSVLVTDYQKNDHWRYNRKLCVSAVNMIVCALHARQQMLTGEVPAPQRARSCASAQGRGRICRSALHWHGLAEKEPHDTAN